MLLSLVDRFWSFSTLSAVFDLCSPLNVPKAEQDFSTFRSAIISSRKRPLKNERDHEKRDSITPSNPLPCALSHVAHADHVIYFFTLFDRFPSEWDSKSELRVFSLSFTTIASRIGEHWKKREHTASTEYDYTSNSVALSTPLSCVSYVTHASWCRGGS